MFKYLLMILLVVGNLFAGTTFFGGLSLSDTRTVSGTVGLITEMIVTTRNADKSIGATLNVYQVPKESVILLDSTSNTINFQLNTKYKSRTIGDGMVKVLAVKAYTHAISITQNIIDQAAYTPGTTTNSTTTDRVLGVGTGQLTFDQVGQSAMFVYEGDLGKWIMVPTSNVMNN